MAASRKPAPPIAIWAGRGDLGASLVLIFPLLLAYEVGVVFAGHVSGVDMVTRALYMRSAAASRTSRSTRRLRPRF